MIRQLYGITVSPGTLVAWVEQAATALAGTADLIKQHVHQAPLLHANESGLRVAGILQPSPPFMNLY